MSGVPLPHVRRRTLITILAVNWNCQVKFLCPSSRGILVLLCSLSELDVAIVDSIDCWAVQTAAG